VGAHITEVDSMPLHFWQRPGMPSHAIHGETDTNVPITVNNKICEI
jgi:hypothetical protein